jgi:hypothetical protein
MKTEVNIDTLGSVATAANNAALAAKNASEAASQASQNAAVAAKAAADSATAIAVVATDTSWMKKSLTGIEATLNDMSKAFVTAVQHQEVCKNISDHEIRLTALEGANIKNVVLLSVGIGILTLLTSLIVYHVVGTR